MTRIRKGKKIKLTPLLLPLPFLPAPSLSPLFLSTFSPTLSALSLPLSILMRCFRFSTFPLPPLPSILFPLPFSFPYVGFEMPAPACAERTVLGLDGSGGGGWSWSWFNREEEARRRERRVCGDGGTV